MPCCLVTGATGFVGSNLAEHLRRLGWNVRCLVRDAGRGGYLKELGAELVLGRLDDMASLERAAAGCDLVFHAAGRLHALSPQEFSTDNVEGTRHVAQACAAQPQPPTLVFISSLAAGGPSRPGKPRREDDPNQPVSAYGESKLDAERAAAALADEAPLSIVRPPIIFGPRDKSSLKIFRGVQSVRLHPVPGLRRFPVSVVHVSDLCDALVRVAEQGKRVAPSPNGRPNIAEGTYHVAAERTIPYGELGRLAGRALGCRAIVLPLPKFLFWLFGGLVEVIGQARGKPGLLNLDKVREALAAGWECTDEKIRNQLGYQPARPLEERFRETAQWYRQAGWLK
ncbi:MAG: NAD-dependent epimerase/dehydratase family protein [Pirellulales bacterium]|nr:NAD-dependent epimerase/dehydratase family protein [Pirellulales bacterium]